MLQKSPLLHAIQKLIEARPSHTADLPLRNSVDTGLSDCYLEPCPMTSEPERGV